MEGLLGCGFQMLVGLSLPGGNRSNVQRMFDTLPLLWDGGQQAGHSPKAPRF